MRLDPRDIDLIADAVAERWDAQASEANQPAPTEHLAPTSPESVLSVAEVAKQVGLGHQAVRRAIRRGELRAEKLCGRIRIESRAVQDWREAHRLRSAPTPVGTSARRIYPEKGLRRLLDKPQGASV
jgi:excisionase family DNA binding protein